MLDGKTSISNCPVGTITIAATQAQVHIVLPDSCTYAFGTADSYSTSSDVGGKYEMVYNNYMGLSFGFFEAESATNPMNGPDYEWLDKGSAMPDNGPELKSIFPMQWKHVSTWCTPPIGKAPRSSRLPIYTTATAQARTQPGNRNDQAVTTRRWNHD